MSIQINSSGWQIRRRSRAAGTRGAVPADLPGLRSDFLASGSRVAEEAILQPAPGTRRRSDAGGALDIAFAVDARRTAVLAVRRPSGALTFSLPIERTSRSGRARSTVRFQVPAPPSATRGAAGEAVKVILIEVAKAAADKAARFVLPRLAEALEREIWAREGLREGWHLVSKETLGTGALEARPPVSPQRSLLLLHGSFSHAASTFRPLADSEFFARVKSAYEDRIFAFDYFSVSRTPEETARRLLTALPEQETTFDVVSHGVGGLVLRNIVEGAPRFGELSRRFTLRHAVLVASPNRGTPIASVRRWENTLGWLANVLEMFPDSPLTTGPAFVANGLVWLANHALGDLPGLRALDESSESFDAIQSLPAPSSAYSALAANYQPGGAMVQRLLDMGRDQFFGGANDVVMPSEGAWRMSRSGGSPIPSNRIGCFGPGGNLQGNSVTHLSYFSQPSSIDFIVNALLGHRQPLAVVDLRKPLPDRRLLRGATDAPPPAATAAKGPGRHGVDDSHAERSKSLVLRITVVNGDLTFEGDPLLIGHYQATRLTGTEKVMDRLIGGAMARSLAMGVYPLEAGSHQIFINNRPSLEQGTFLPRPKAVIVVGLGEEGKLRAADLVKSVRQAVIAWSRRLTEQTKRPGRAFELAATLLGSGGTGIAPGEAGRLIAEGVYQANELLADLDTRDGSPDPDAPGTERNRRPQRSGHGHDETGPAFPQVSHLRFNELYLDRATDAWRSLRLQAEATPGRYDVDGEVKAGTGALLQPPDLGYRGAEYDFITVEAGQDTDGTPLISYKLDTRRARSEVRGQRAQSHLIGELVATGSNDKNNETRIGRTLFDLVIPIEIEAYLTGSSEMQIELDPQTASIPWELLESGRDSGEIPWAIKVKLLRKLRIRKFRDAISDAHADDGALVIGEPACPEEYVRLYGARQEACAVDAALTGEKGLRRDQVVALIGQDASQAGPSASEVVNALFERPWRIVHISGHGAPGTDGKPGGVVLSNGTFLGPAEIGSLRTVPELVFVNCCYLGAADARELLNSRFDRATFASGVAGALIALGVRCVVAAGWAVDDGGAQLFAEAFYRSLLDGDRFIEAVSRARNKTFEHNRDQNTWAAYQCYGDPDWVFRQVAPDANRATPASTADFSRIGSAWGLKRELEQITVETRYQGYDPGVQLEKLRIFERRYARRWGAQGDVAELFGGAFTEAGDIEAGVKWYTDAVKAADGRAKMTAAEQLANAQGRLAWERVDRAMRHRDDMRQQEASKSIAPAARRDARRARLEAERVLKTVIARAKKMIEDSLGLLEKLCAVHPTLERAALVGSAYKRRALVNLAAGRWREVDRDVRLMAATYAEAQRLGEGAGTKDLYYPASNRLVAEVALNAIRRPGRRLDRLVKTVRQSLAAKDPGFWTVVGATELDLYEALGKRQLASMRPNLQKAYADLHRRVQSRRMWGSVYDTACLTLPVYAARAPKGEGAAAEELLVQLRSYAHPAPQ